jgi:lactoylglutathione lyase
MDFCWCTLHVDDLEGSLKFYSEAVGLTVERRISAPGTEIVFLGNGETKIELIRDRDPGSLNRPLGISLGFRVSSLDETVEALRKKGIPVDSGPYQPNPHVRFLYVRDPNGLLVQFVENL